LDSCSGIWKKILHFKYNIIFTGTISTFWPSIKTIIPFMRINMKHLVGTRVSVEFLFCFGSMFEMGIFSLEISTSHLFAKAKNAEKVTVAQV
jgi:hypothetical protein